MVALKSQNHNERTDHENLLRRARGRDRDVFHVQGHDERGRPATRPQRRRKRRGRLRVRLDRERRRLEALLDRGIAPNRQATPPGRDPAASRRTTKREDSS
nr:MAG TPA: hypothetical protein [Caudoviricetes sp.]